MEPERALFDELFSSSPRPTRVPARRRIHQLLEVAKTGDRASASVDLALMALIVVSIIATILESMPSYAMRYQALLLGVEIVAVAVFTLEYVLRIACIVESADPRYQHPVWGRIRYAL